MDTPRRHPGFCLLLALLVAAGSVAAAGQQGAARGTTASVLPTTSSASGGVFATPLNVVALANAMGWKEAPPPTGAARPGERLLGGPSPSEWAASEWEIGDAVRLVAHPAMRGSLYAFGPDRPTPELCRLCVYRL